MVHRINLSFIDPELSRQLESGEDPSSQYPFRERGLNLSNHGIYGIWHTRIGVNGINAGVQISDLMGDGFSSMLGHLIVSMRRSSSPLDFLALYFWGFAR